MYTEVKISLEMNPSLLLIDLGFEFEKLLFSSFTIIIVTFKKNSFYYFTGKGRKSRINVNT